MTVSKGARGTVEDMAYLSLFIIVLAFIASSKALPYIRCATPIGRLEKLEVSGCETGDVCKLKIGDNVTAIAKFVSDEDVYSPFLFVDIILGPLTIPVVQRHDVCASGLLECPINKDVLYEFQRTVTVKDEFPVASASVRAYGKDQTDRMLFCLEVKIELIE